MKTMPMLLWLVAASSGQAAPEPDYFPLQSGNQWVLQTGAVNPQLQQIEVLRSRKVNGREYFLVTGYLPQAKWLRESDEGMVFALDEASGDDLLITWLKPNAGPYKTPLSGCVQTAIPASETAPHQGRYIDADGALAVRYSPDQCADIGYTIEAYGAGIGPLRRSSTSFRGELTYELIYARVNGKTVVSKSKEIVLHSDFANGSERWLAGFSDYSLKTADLERIAEIRPMPDELNASRTGFYLQGMNRSDDLFMFLKRPVATGEGLDPNQAYRVAFDIHLASNAQTGCLGAGGAPGESVYLKAGASVDEPLSLLSGDSIQLSIDKGQQAAGGKDAGVAGTIANGQPCDGKDAPYLRLRRQYAHSETVTTDDRGSLWLVVGTDSAFEGLTGLYVESITARIIPASEPASVRKGLR
jgi:hypothetical protein